MRTHPVTGEQVPDESARRFGFIATNSLWQTFNRRVVAHHPQAGPSLALVYAVPDHPWVDAAEGADGRISMTVAQAGLGEGLLERVTREVPGPDHAVVELSGRQGLINADLTVGPNVANAKALEANEGLSCRGVSLHGAGFIVTPEEAGQLGLGRIAGLHRHIRQYRNGRDITSRPRGVMVIDLFGLTAEQVRTRFPEVYQWVHDRVKRERDLNNRPSYRDNWWIHGEARSDFRTALAGRRRYIATVETSKHRFFVFLDASVLPDNKLVNIALDDAYFLGVLSSQVHVAWALAAGGRLGVGNDPRYNKTRCLEPFPFPDATEVQRGRIRALGESLDAHRKRQQELFPELTITGMYNVLERLRSAEPFSDDDRSMHEQGLVSVLREIHDELDAAVLDAYGWPQGITTEEILYRLSAGTGPRRLIRASRGADAARCRSVGPHLHPRPPPGGLGDRGYIGRVESGSACGERVQGVAPRRPIVVPELVLLNVDAQSKRLPARFYRSGNGREPVREWLMNLHAEDRRAIGEDIKEVEFSWPVGMPLVRPMGRGRWEVRSGVSDGRIARVLFCVANQRMVLLHGFIKKAEKTPNADLELARSRMKGENE
jgi:phage-related protein